MGVTGHQDLEPDGLLDRVIGDQLGRIKAKLPFTETEIRLTVVSQLAEGADRLLIRVVREGAGERPDDVRLEVILPFHSSVYPALQGFSEASRREFESLLERAASVTEPASVEPPDDRSDAYESASRQLVARSDVLLALWDGGPTGGRGGTAETLLDGAVRSKPCVWISTDGDPKVRENLSDGSSSAFSHEVATRAEASGDRDGVRAHHPQDVLEPLRATFSMLDEFNRERLPAGFEEHLRGDLERLGHAAGWVAAPFTRATLLSARWRRRFRWSSWLIFAFAMAAATTLALSLSFGEGATGWHWAEAGFLVLALAGLFIVRRAGFHRRWLSYRVLAERLRSAHYLAPTVGRRGSRPSMSATVPRTG